MVKQVFRIAAPLSIILAAVVAVVCLMLFTSDGEAGALRPVTAEAELDGSAVSVMFTNNAGRPLRLDEGTFAYVKAGRTLKTAPKIIDHTGFKLETDGEGWSKALPAGRRAMSFTIANPPRGRYCMVVTANVYGRGGEASLLADTVVGRGCTS